MSNGDQHSPADKPALAALIDGYTARIRVIGRCAKKHIRLATEGGDQWLRELREKANCHTPDAVRELASYLSSAAFQDDLHAHTVVPHSRILSQSLLIFGFSAFDAFLGLFLKQLYREERHLLHKLEEKSLTVCDILKGSSVDDILDRIVENDISSLLRESYDKLFSKLAGRHGLDTIKKFASWPKFVESSQRRNLVTHCDGVVSAQYIDACRQANFPLGEGVKIGSRLTVDAAYLKDTFDILYEVGVMLGVTLWRTASETGTELSEKFLTDELFRLLLRSEWDLAKKIGEFAVKLPKQKSDLQSRISRINYAQALKWSGDRIAGEKVLSAVDWSSSIRDLRLGVEVLRENYDNAAKLMAEIGRNGELVDEVGYRKWPVFREFRKTEQFASAFLAVFGTNFASLPVVYSQPSQIAEESKATGPAAPTDKNQGEPSMPSGPSVEIPLEEDTGNADSGEE